MLPARLRLQCLLASIGFAVPGLLVSQLISHHNPLLTASLAVASMTPVLAYCFWSRTALGPEGVLIRWAPRRARRYGWHEIAGVEVLVGLTGTRSVRLRRHQGKPLLLPMVLNKDRDFDRRVEQIRAAVSRYTGIPQDRPEDDESPWPDQPVKRRVIRVSGYWQAAVALVLGLALAFGPAPELRAAQQDLTVYRTAPACTYPPDPPHCRVYEKLVVDHVDRAKNRRSTTVYLQMADGYRYPLTTGRYEPALDALQPGTEVWAHWVTGIDGLSITYPYLGTVYDDDATPMTVLSDNYRAIAPLSGFCLFFACWAVMVLRRGGEGRRFRWLVPIAAVPMVLSIVQDIQRAQILTPPWTQWGITVTAVIALTLLLRRLSARFHAAGGADWTRQKGWPAGSR